MGLLILVLAIACFFGPRAVLRAFGGFLTLVAILGLLLAIWWFVAPDNSGWGRNHMLSASEKIEADHLSAARYGH